MNKFVAFIYISIFLSSTLGMVGQVYSQTVTIEQYDAISNSKVDSINAKKLTGLSSVRELENGGTSFAAYFDPVWPISQWTSNSCIYFDFRYIGVISKDLQIDWMSEEIGQYYYWPNQDSCLNLNKADAIRLPELIDSESLNTIVTNSTELLTIANQKLQEAGYNSLGYTNLSEEVHISSISLHLSEGLGTVYKVYFQESECAQMAELTFSIVNGEFFPITANRVEC